ncbi:MAG TPA: hypothetical protein VE907_13865 [Gammaproteobacteria bacterium]|nr:hypothetical protein [Gammaproteobacteria bacterium]
MSARRFAVTCFVVFVLSQVFEVAIHGFLLNADYEPYRGTLLRNEDAWQFLLLPLAHLSFVIAFVYVFTRSAEPGAGLGQGLRFGFLAWLMTQVPLWTIWYAEQPWPGMLLVKQLGLELVSMLALGAAAAALYRGGASAARRILASP